MEASRGGDGREAYQALAPVYDEFTHRNDYEMWCGVLLGELARHGLQAGRVLDVGCGTGRAFEPMLDRGWEVRGCDLSPAMIAQARSKFGERVALTVADVRELPVFGSFELVWALNDVVNYLVEDGDLGDAFAGMASNLASPGLLLFDSNPLAVYEDAYMSGADGGMSAGGWQWRGRSRQLREGGTFEAELSGPGISAHVHRQRHHTQAQIEAALAEAGLEPIAVLGQHEDSDGIVLSSAPSEEHEGKLIHIARCLNR